MRFSVRLTKAFLERSYSQRFFAGRWRLLCAIVTTLVLVAVFWEDPRFRNIAPVLLGVVAAAVLIFGLAWVRYRRWIGAWLKSQGDAPVEYAFSPEAIETSSRIGQTSLKWEAMSKVEVNDLDTLITWGNSGALTLPTDQIPLEAMSFLQERSVALGKKFKDNRKTQKA